MSDQHPYTRTTVDRLVEGEIFVGISEWDRKDWVAVDGAWADIRSEIERTGQVESKEWLEVLDLERAILALRDEHPEAALVVVAQLWGFEAAELRSLKNYDALKERAKAFIRAWLSGEDSEEAYRKAYRRNGRRRAS